MHPIRVCIAGTRTFNDYSLLKAIITNAFFDISRLHIISGHAKGADELGELYAKEMNLRLEVYPADWTTYGKGAGAIRNAKMASISDCLVAFWDGESRGTKNMINNMKRLGKPVLIYNYITNTYEK